MYDQVRWWAARDEFAKIAKGMKDRVDSHALGLGALGVGAGFGLNSAAAAMLPSAVQYEMSLPGNVANIRRLQAASPVPVAEHPWAELGGGGVYVGKDVIEKVKKFPGAESALPHQVPHVLISPGGGSGGVLAHEIGHAHVDQHALGRMMQSAPMTAASNKLPYAAPISGFLAGRYTDENKGTGLGIAAGLPLGVEAAHLGAEGWASHKGIKSLQAAGAAPAEIAAAKRTLRRAFGTHAGFGLLSAGLGVGAYGAGRKMRASAKKHEALQPQQQQQ